MESLKHLVEGGYNVVAVVTQPDKPVGRHQDTLQPSQVKQYAVEHGLPVLQPVKMKDPDFVEPVSYTHLGREDAFSRFAKLLSTPFQVHRE